MTEVCLLVILALDSHIGTRALTNSVAFSFAMLLAAILERIQPMK